MKSNVCTHVVYTYSSLIHTISKLKPTECHHSAIDITMNTLKTPKIKYLLYSLLASYMQLTKLHC